MELTLGVGSRLKEALEKQQDVEEVEAGGGGGVWS